MFYQWLSAERKAAKEAVEAQKKQEEEETIVNRRLNDEENVFLRWDPNLLLQHVLDTETTVTLCFLEKAIGNPKGFDKDRTSFLSEWRLMWRAESEFHVVAKLD